MNEKQKAEVTNGMFAGATFVDSVVVGVAEAGSEVFYNKGEVAKEKEPKITLTKDMLYQIVPQIQQYFRGSSSYAVLFCVGRDEFNYPDNMSQFEREMGDCPEPEQLDYLCPAGTLASAFYHNSYLKLPVKTWKDNGVKDKVLLLADHFRKAVKELNSKKEPDTEK